ncbi:MAG TPA: hypothetical protein RMH99_14280 [Sandaracinaceae bacterium LLY-WYZ-13_1]|nr:hypothetical protein [Sandaracinaceae bacterium LLY-WYZ-13_1]
MRHGALKTALALLATAAMAFGLAGCAEPGPDIDRTQANLVDKSIFEGEWWYTRTVIELDDDAAWAINAAGAGAPWPGAMANYDLASRSGVIGRIRWVIDENFLMAYRSHEVIHGAEEDADDDEFIGEPLAIFPITEHVDVRREYSSVTGEPTNVISESQDRRWYDRQYVRVDWSQNLVTMGLFGAGLDLEEFFATFRREPAQNFVQEGGDERTPDSWRPQFVRIGDDPDYRFADEWPADMQDSVHYMSFVTNELWTPTNCPSTVCSTSIRMSLRHAFLRVPPEHEYAVETLPHSEYDRFGIIRTESRTFIGGGEDRSEIGRFCDAACGATCDFDEDCGAGGRCEIDGSTGVGSCVAGSMEDIDDCGAGYTCDYATGTCEDNVDADCDSGLCNLDTHMCEGGLTPYRGETDFLTFYRLRHNFYADSLQEDRPCVADWQCDNRYGTVEDVPASMTDGSTCDSAAGLCTVPLRERPVRPVEYHLSPHYPQHLVRSAFEVMTQWNETFMTGNRQLHGDALPTPSAERMDCQSDDPTQYCFCGAVNAPEVAEDGTCSYRSDFFVPPSERPESEPFDCWVGLVGPDGEPAPEGDVNPSNPTSYDDYTDDVYRYAFFGEECMFRLNVNSCDVPVEEGQDPAACEELGDIRYQFFNYTTGAGAGWCGVMQPLQDPTTGEAVAIPINMGGLCLDRIATNAIDLWPVLRGELSEDVLVRGENVRGYYDNLGNTHYPIGLASSVDGVEYSAEDPSRPAMPVDLNAHLNDMFENMAPSFLRLGSSEEGRQQIMSDRLRRLQGTGIERRLVSGLVNEALPGVSGSNVLEAANMAERGDIDPDSQAMIDRVSPFGDGMMDLLNAGRMREQQLANNYIYYPRDALYTSRYNQWWANAFEDREIEEAHIRWRQAFHRAVMLHEMGHGLGLEHNFAGSYDRDHYQDGYFNLVTQVDGDGDRPFALPTIEEFDCGSDGLCPGDSGYPGADDGERDSLLTDDESNAWAEAVREIRTRRALNGIGNTMTSSLMDYNGDLSDMAGLGRYDRAAVYFNYFNLVEAFDGDPIYREGASSSLDGLLRSDTTDRTLWTWYRGGESCDVDSDCPYAQGSEALTDDQRIFQRCVRNPRFSSIPEPCNGDRSCICSTFDEDFIDFYEFVEPRYNPDGDGDGVADYAPVQYMFCSNSRLTDISWCNTFDAGESFQETIDHFRQLWQEGYPRNYFRNYRSNFFAGSRATRYIIDAAKIYQHLFFRYFYEPDFRRETGPLGFNDQYLASVDAMNWLAELAQMPDVGSYELQLVEGPAGCSLDDPEDPGNPAGCEYAYAHMGNEMDMAGSDITLEPGQGYYHWSRYQDGLYGFFQMERAGVFWDKLVALQALTIRDWNLSFFIDERFFINFYDLFPVEMTELFGGYVIDDNRWMAPRVTVDEDSGEAQVYYLNYLRGNCRDATTGSTTPCRESNAEEFEQPPLMGTSNDVLRLYAAIYALAQFPVFYDPSFESRLAIFKLDNADGFTIPDVDNEGNPTTAYGAAIPGSGHSVTTDPEEADYITFVSDRLHTPYVAVKVRQRLTYNLEEEQLGYQLLLRLYEQQERVRALEAIADPTTEQRAELARLRRDLTSGESFLESLIEVQRIFGITSWL